MTRKHRDEHEHEAAAAAGAERAGGEDVQTDTDAPEPGPGEMAGEEAGGDATRVGEAGAADAAGTAGPVLEPPIEEQLRRERDELQDRLLRLAAEMDNLRKRTRREVEDARRFAALDILRPLLEVQDNFQRALQAATADAESGAAVAAPGDVAFRQGIEMIAQSFDQALQDRGVRRIEALGQTFDPALHEAVGQAPAPDEETESGAVMHVVQDGYVLDGLVIRPSRVIVAQ